MTSNPVPPHHRGDRRQKSVGSDQSSGGAISRALRLWFGVRDDVGRGVYASTGFTLMLVKYAGEALAIRHFAGTWFSPIDFLNPLLSVRSELMRPGPDWLPWAIFAWTLPFLWIAFSMSIRRAANAGLSPWLGLLILVPVVNVVAMLLLAVLPAAAGPHWTSREAAVTCIHQLRSAVCGIALSFVIAGAMLALSVYGFDTYGTSLFFGTPLVMGAVSSFVYNRPHARSWGSSLFVAFLSSACAGLALILFALEGAICILMAAPLVVPLGLVGGLIGKAVADYAGDGRYLIPPIVFMLPLVAGAESLYRPGTEFVVLSSVEINAPPEVVWRRVIDFPELPPPDEWYFRVGIACPQRARIDGRGIGATRYCEFTTGTFVETITAWDEPRRLAFDVTSQPPPLYELTPYRHIHPPHLDGVLQSTRGEFRLVPLPDGRTRLEGRTWYRFDMRPQSYWTLWSDLFIHRIHLRVLRHVARLAEGDSDQIRRLSASSRSATKPITFAAMQLK